MPNTDYSINLNEKDLEVIKKLRNIGVFKYKVTREGEIEIIFFQDIMGGYEDKFEDLKGLKPINEHPSQVDLFERELKEIDKAKDDLFRGGI